VPDFCCVRERVSVGVREPESVGDGVLLTDGERDALRVPDMLELMDWLFDMD
jgi:hypothetical protein